MHDSRYRFLALVIFYFALSAVKVVYHDKTLLPRNTIMVCVHGACDDRYKNRGFIRLTDFLAVVRFWPIVWGIRNRSRRDRVRACVSLWRLTTLQMTAKKKKNRLKRVIPTYSIVPRYTDHFFIQTHYEWTCVRMKKIRIDFYFYYYYFNPRIPTALK